MKAIWPKYVKHYEVKGTTYINFTPFCPCPAVVELQIILRQMYWMTLNWPWILWGLVYIILLVSPTTKFHSVSLYTGSQPFLIYKSFWKRAIKWLNTKFSLSTTRLRVITPPPNFSPFCSVITFLDIETRYVQVFVLSLATVLDFSLCEIFYVFNFKLTQEVTFVGAAEGNNCKKLGWKRIAHVEGIAFWNRICRKIMCTKWLHKWLWTV